ncbi:hypothetical protein LEP1GSC131_0265 [Leptospira kirschneri str. 200802841]|uniref:Uncharacterized protein n=1 Tax=Leptospira kirschneri str. 200802841 TaxID=1193047 RepID=A0A828XXT7_9LEPT|nr:hypothetical protein LEP1GSC131_0265 [Leptospira kirschneri str. 200802841]
MNLILKFHNNLTGAKSPVRLPVASRIRPVFLRSAHVEVLVWNYRSEIF